MKTLLVILCRTVISTQVSNCQTAPVSLKEAQEYVDTSNVVSPHGPVYYWIREAQPCEINGGC